MKFGAEERRVVEIISNSINDKIKYNGNEYIIKKVGKPTCSRGEPKTDIYIGAEDSNSNICEFKISYKKDNADFLENKTSAERALQLFGSNWEKIIQKMATELSTEFANKPLIFFDGFGRTEKGSITLGWKFELVNKASGELSRKLPLTPEQLYNVYSGITLSEDKRNSKVNGEVIINSGVASHILVGQSHNTAQDVFDSIETVDSFCKSNAEVYGVFKAHNYRTFKSKDDGNRPLGVYVNWTIKDDKLHSEISFEKPLNTKGFEIRGQLLNTLKTLDVTNTDDLKDLVHSSVSTH